MRPVAWICKCFAKCLPSYSPPLLTSSDCRPGILDSVENFLILLDEWFSYYRDLPSFKFNIWPIVSFLSLLTQRTTANIIWCCRSCNWSRDNGLGLIPITASLREGKATSKVTLRKKIEVAMSIARSKIKSNWHLSELVRFYVGIPWSIWNWNNFKWHAILSCDRR